MLLLLYCFAFLFYSCIYLFLWLARNNRSNLGTTNQENSLKFYFFFDFICLSQPFCSPDFLLLLLSHNSIGISVFRHFLGLFSKEVTHLIYFAYNLKACFLLVITAMYLIIVCKCQGSLVWSFYCCCCFHFGRFFCFIFFRKDPVLQVQLKKV